MVKQDMIVARLHLPTVCMAPSKVMHDASVNTALLQVELQHPLSFPAVLHKAVYGRQSMCCRDNLL